MRRQGPGTSSPGPLGSPSRAGAGCAVAARGRIRPATTWHEARRARRSTARQHDAEKNGNEEQRRERSHRRRMACRRSRARRRRRQLGFAGAVSSGSARVGAARRAGRGTSHSQERVAVDGLLVARAAYQLVRLATRGGDACERHGCRDAGWWMRCRAWAQRCTQGGAAARQRRPWPPACGVDEAEWGRC